MNEWDKLKKYTLLPAIDEQALHEMLDMLSLLEELPKDGRAEKAEAGELRRDQVQPMMNFSVLSSYMPVLSQEGIAISSLLPAKEEKA